MKTKLHYISILSLLSVLIALSIILSNCANTTGETTKTTPTEIAPTPQPVVKDITPEEASNMLITSKSIIIIDVRTPQEYASGYIRGAINIDLNSPTFKEEIGKLDKNKTYMVYCRSGVRSAAARDIMKGLGFEHVINVLGGITAWEAAGLPLEK